MITEVQIKQLAIYWPGICREGLAVPRVGRNIEGRGETRDLKSDER